MSGNGEGLAFGQVDEQGRMGETSASTPRAGGWGRGSRHLLLGLWLVGLLHWAWFLGPASDPLRGPSFLVEDWRKEYRYYAVLQEAVLEGKVPYLISRPIHTRRFLALPEVTWSPQILLLRVLDIGPFVVANTLLLFTLGSVGLALLSRRLGLGPLAVAPLYLVFGFGGHITAHLAVGHSMWAAYFLYPFVLLGLLDVLDGRGVWRLSLPLFAIALQGGFHLLVFAALLVALVALFERGRLVPLVGALVWAGFLSACRFAPAYFLLDRKDQAFLSGFPSVGVLWAGLVAVREASAPRVGGLFDTLNWWEFDFYVGYAGLAWIVSLGVVRLFARRGRSPLVPPALFAAAVVLAFLSLGDLWAPVNALPLPVVSAERVSTRFLILPLLVLAAGAARSTEEWLRDLPSRTRYAAVVLLTVALGLSLFQHSRNWRVERLEAELPSRTGRLEIAISPLPSGSSHEAYVTTVRVSGLVSVLSLVALGVWSLRPGRRRSGSSG